MPSETVNRFLSVLSYICDYVLVIGLIVVFTVLDRIEPFHQHFALTNISLQYPYALSERVPVILLAFLAGVIPLVIILVWTLILDGILSHNKDGKGRFTRYSFKDRLWQANAGVLGLLLSVSFAVVITASLKNTVGKPRPDLLARCLPKAGSADAPVFGLTTSAICTQGDNNVLKDGFRSFPSGHSSTAFAGLFYLSLFMAGKMHVMDKRGQSYKTFLVLIPSLGAALIAASRIMDARHHGFDVLSGSVIGIFTAWGAYRQYFPPVHESWRKGRAWHPRTWGNTSTHAVVPSDEPPPTQHANNANENITPPKERPSTSQGASYPTNGAPPYNAETPRSEGGAGLTFGRNDVEMGPTSRTRTGRRDRSRSRDGRNHLGSSNLAQNLSESTITPTNYGDRAGVVTSRSGMAPSPQRLGATPEGYHENLSAQFLSTKPYAAYRSESAALKAPGYAQLQGRQYFVLVKTPSPPPSPSSPTTMGGQHKVHNGPYLPPPSLAVSHHARGQSEVASFHEVGLSSSQVALPEESRNQEGGYGYDSRR